jgi:hypothetical protein
MTAGAARAAAVGALPVVGPTERLALPTWHRQGPAARYGRCRAR